METAGPVHDGTVTELTNVAIVVVVPTPAKRAVIRAATSIDALEHEWQRGRRQLQILIDDGERAAEEIDRFDIECLLLRSILVVFGVWCVERVITRLLPRGQGLTGVGPSIESALRHGHAGIGTGSSL
jgi:hypothetical protein